MLIAIAINIILVMLTVVIHYEVLYRLAITLPHQNLAPRYRILTGVFVILLAHIVEIWLFAFAYYFMNSASDFGTLTGNIQQDFLSCVYFSFTTYTTLGYGDIQPSGHIRFVAGLESLTGLVMITWSASFLFLEMQKYWSKK